MLEKLTVAQSPFGLILGCAMVTVLITPSLTLAKDEAPDRHRFYGFVESRPEGLHGTWVIGGRQITTQPQTEFDQEEGLLQVGACVKVEIRGGRVHEIDSEPASNCQ